MSQVSSTALESSTIELQAEVAHAVADRIVDDWERIFVNYEMRRTDEGRLVDYILFYIKVGVDGELEKISVRGGSDAIDDAYIALADAMARDGEPWGSCDFTLDADGRTEFRFFYEAPKRLDGVLDHSSYGRFRNYLDQYRVERAAKAAG